MAFIFFLLVAIVALAIWRSSSKKYRDQRNLMLRTSTIVSGSVAILATTLALLQCFTVIPAGYVGVIDFFGTVSDNTLKAGINAVNPFARIIKFSVKTEELKEVMDVP